MSGNKCLNKSARSTGPAVVIRTVDGFKMRFAARLMARRSLEDGCGGVILVEHKCAWDQFFAELVTEVCEVCAFDGCTTSGGCGDANASCIEGICQ